MRASSMASRPVLSACSSSVPGRWRENRLSMFLPFRDQSSDNRPLWNDYGMGSELFPLKALLFLSCLAFLVLDLFTAFSNSPLNCLRVQLKSAGNLCDEVGIHRNLDCR